MVPAAHAVELPDDNSEHLSSHDMLAKLEQEFKEADDFFAPLVPQQEQDANRSSVKDFMSRPEAYHNNHSEPTVLDALLYAAGRATGGAQSISKDAEVLVDPFGFQEAIRTGNITSHMQRAQNLSDGIAATYETVRKDGLLPIFNSRVQHYQNQMSEARNQAERGNFFGAGYTSGEAQMDVAKDALALTGLGYGAAGLGRLAGRQAMNQGKLLYQMGTMGVEQGRAAFALADGLNAPFLGRGYSAPIDRAARGFNVNKTAPHELFPPQAGRPDAVGQPLLHKFKPLDHNGKPLKTGLRIYQEGREVVTYAQRNDANLVGKNVGNPILNQFKYKTTNVKTSDLQPTHGINYSKKAFEKFVAKIKTEGIQEPVRYVVHGGVKHIVDGHHRLFAARELNLPNIPAVEVKLPYKGYKTVNDLVFGL